MIDSVKMNRIRIKKDEIHISLLDLNKIKRKLWIYLGLMVLAIVMIISFDVSSSSSQRPEAELLLAKGFMQFAGIIFWSIIFFLFRIYSFYKEIKELKMKYKEMVEEVQHQYN